MDSMDLQMQPVVQEPHETYRGGRSCGMNGGSRLDRQGFDWKKVWKSSALCDTGADGSSDCATMQDVCSSTAIEDVDCGPRLPPERSSNHSS